MSDDAGPFGPMLNGTMVIVFYEYRPSDSAALAFIALFALATLAHLVYLIWLKAWFCIPLILGGVAETFGYYGRYLSHSQPSDLGSWIMQNLLILVASPLIAASVYMSLGRVAGSLGAHRSRWLSKGYVLLDLVVLFSQLIGTVMPASGNARLVALSQKVIAGGLIVQIAALVVFVAITWRVHQSIRANPSKEVASLQFLNWETYLRAIEIVTIAIIVRSFIRLIEYIQGNEGYIISHEAFIYVFDASLMWLVMVAFAWLHPQKLIRQARQADDKSDRIEMMGTYRGI